MKDGAERVPLKFHIRRRLEPFGFGTISARSLHFVAAERPEFGPPSTMWASFGSILRRQGIPQHSVNNRAFLRLCIRVFHFSHGEHFPFAYFNLKYQSRCVTWLTLEKNATEQAGAFWRSAGVLLQNLRVSAKVNALEKSMGCRLSLDMTETHREKRLIGYARISTFGQTLDSQLEQLRKAGCSSRNIFREKVTSARADLPRA